MAHVWSDATGIVAWKHSLQKEKDILFWLSDNKVSMNHLENILIYWLPSK